jgi:hypothetical protein
LVGWRVVLLFVVMWLPTISAGEITGRLGFFRDEEGAKYFGVAVDRTLVLKSSEGGMLRSDFPQLAGLDQKKYEQAVNWNGRRVRVTGGTDGAAHGASFHAGAVVGAGSGTGG